MCGVKFIGMECLLKILSLSQYHGKLELRGLIAINYVQAFESQNKPN